ncbi:DUF2325 domain-containing protein [Desulfotomaculum sp. 1211_IL3151]|uniref:DUF2325 domain-containing protein n=1 Tax=Desulfotomaculum sp. 1211_IL3151 TaxID=3084055 RepID=UPI002FDB5B67
MKELTPKQITAWQLCFTHKTNNLSMVDIAKQVDVHVSTLRRWKQTYAWKSYQSQVEQIEGTHLDTTSCNAPSEQAKQKLQQENEELKAILDTFDEDLQAYEAKINALEEENLNLLIKIDELQNRLREQNYQYYNHCNCEKKETETCDQNCCNFDFCAKRVLIVGGITKFKTFYKNLIEQKGGEFDYSDGYMKGGERALDCKIKRCDIVLCPVDCNSHNACLSVKKLCKKHGKPFKMLMSSSVSGISEAIR